LVTFSKLFITADSVVTCPVRNLKQVLTSRVQIHSKAKPQELIVSLQRYWENCESTSRQRGVKRYFFAVGSTLIALLAGTSVAAVSTINQSINRSINQSASQSVSVLNK